MNDNFCSVFLRQKLDTNQRDEVVYLSRIFAREFLQHQHPKVRFEHGRYRNCGEYLNFTGSLVQGAWLRIMQK